VGFCVKVESSKDGGSAVCTTQHDPTKKSGPKTEARPVMGRNGIAGRLKGFGAKGFRILFYFLLNSKLKSKPIQMNSNRI
jgi:hypothetical protein